MSLRLRTRRGSTISAEIFVEIARWKHEQKSLACWGGDSASGTVEQGCVERLKLIGWLRGAWSFTLTLWPCEGPSGERSFTGAGTWCDFMQVEGIGQWELYWAFQILRI